FEDELKRDLPRGVEGEPELPADARWLPVDDLKAWDFRQTDGKAAGIFLGYRDSRPVGITDDHHILTVAGSRSIRSG
ncbi:hypothetical protein JDN40_00395, partial [Rhodomicrobium vannielii ATCC 17100]|nr:hypothetical protein [Rhodomicrobium vannielii ATCC 17100]